MTLADLVFAGVAGYGLAAISLLIGLALAIWGAK